MRIQHGIYASQHEPETNDERGKCMLIIDASGHHPEVCDALGIITKHCILVCDSA